MNQKRTMPSASISIVILACVAADIILHRLAGWVFQFDYVTNNLPQSIFVRNGTFPITAVVGFTLMFGFLSLIYFRLRSGTGMTPLAHSLRFFVPAAFIMFFGVLEPAFVFGTPLKSDIITSFADAIPFVLLGVLLSRVNRPAPSEEKTQAGRSGSWSALIWIALFYIAGRYFSYGILGISSGYIERPAGTLFWTVCTGLSMGAFFMLSGSFFTGSTPLHRALQIGGLTIGVFWLLVQLFYALIFDVSVVDLVIRGIADMIYLVAGIYSYEKLFGRTQAVETVQIRIES